MTRFELDATAAGIGLDATAAGIGLGAIAAGIGDYGWGGLGVVGTSAPSWKVTVAWKRL